MLASLKGSRGSCPSSKGRDSVNCPAMLTKRTGSNISSTGDGIPPVGCQEPQNQCLSSLVLKLQTHTPHAVSLEPTIHVINPNLRE